MAMANCKGVRNAKSLKVQASNRGAALYLLFSAKSSYKTGLKSRGEEIASISLVREVLKSRCK